MAKGEIVGSTFFVVDELFKVEELMVGLGPHLIDGTGHKLSSATLVEEPIEGIVSSIVNLNEEPVEDTQTHWPRLGIWRWKGIHEEEGKRKMKKQKQLRICSWASNFWQKSNISIKGEEHFNEMKYLRRDWG